MKCDLCWNECRENVLIRLTQTVECFSRRVIVILKLSLDEARVTLHRNFPPGTWSRHADPWSSSHFCVQVSARANRSLLDRNSFQWVPPDLPRLNRSYNHSVLLCHSLPTAVLLDFATPKKKIESARVLLSLPSQIFKVFVSRPKERTSSSGSCSPNCHSSIIATSNSTHAPVF
jgi:hypothetical protein